MNRIKPINEIIYILLGQNEYRDTKWIANELQNSLDETFNLRTVKSFLETIQDEWDFLESKKGFGGGYRLRDDAKRKLADFATMQLSPEERNALNDAFEIAEKSPMFHYIPHLRKAKGKLYKDFNLKDNDFEHYLGINLDERKTYKHIATFKQAKNEKKKIWVTSKYQYKTINKEKTQYTPVFLVHDTDESFMILRKQGEYSYENINNIQSIEISDQGYSERSENINKFVNGVSLSIKNKEKHIVRIKITSWEANALIDLWSHEFIRKEELAKDTYEFEFAELYKGLVFLFRLIEYIEVQYLSEELEKQAIKKAKYIKKI